MDKLNKENEAESQERLRVETNDKNNIFINRIVATAILSIALLLGYWGIWQYKNTTYTMDLIDKAKVSEQAGRYEEALGFYTEAKSLSPDFSNIDRLIKDIKKKIEEERKLAEVERKEEERRKEATDLIDKAKTNKQSGRYKAALVFYEEAKSLSPYLPNIDRLIKEIKKKIEAERRRLAEAEKQEKELRKKAMDLIDKAKTSKQSGRYKEALRFYKEAKSLSPDLHNIDRLITEVKEKIVKENEKQAKEEEEKEKQPSVTSRNDQRLVSFLSGMTLSEREDGLTIIGVLPGNPGWDAGLRIGDIIPKIDGKEIKSLDDYLKIAEKLNKTKRLEASLTILREDVLYNVDIKRFNKAVRQSTIEKPPLTIQKKQRIEKPYSKTPRVKLRSTRSRSLSKDDVKDMLGRCNFYDSVWNKGGDFTNDYEAQVVNGDKVVIDHATGLMWHQSGSLQTMNWGETYYWIRELNRQKYAGYRNWRLPTIDEAVTLLESSKIGGENGLYIDSVFDSRQKLIWTSDEKAKTEKTWLGTSTSSGRYWWCVNFTSGTVSWLIKLIELNKHVRPVRTMR